MAVSERSLVVRELKVTLEILVRNPVSLVGLIIVLAFIIIGIIGPYIVPYPAQAWGEHGPSNARWLPPSLAHPFGTDDFGRDVFSRVIVGARLSLVAGVSVVGLALLIGVPLGLVAGYFGGLISSIVNGVVEVFMAFPPILLALVVAATLGRGYWVAILALVISWWPWYSRLVKSVVDEVKAQPYIKAAELLGLPAWRILFRHILPNVLAPVIVQATLDIGSAILSMAALSFLGLGAQPPLPDWGLMVALGKDQIPDYWWVPVFPGLAIFLVVLGFNLLGDGLREAMDPKLRRRWAK